jgi:hypothetical protein
MLIYDTVVICIFFSTTEDTNPTGWVVSLSPSGFWLACAKRVGMPPYGSTRKKGMVSNGFLMRHRKALAVASHEHGEHTGAAARPHPRAAGGLTSTARVLCASANAAAHTLAVPARQEGVSLQCPNPCLAAEGGREVHRQPAQGLQVEHSQWYALPVHVL